MRLNDLRETFCRTKNFRGIMFELFNYKAHEFLRQMRENDKFAHKFKNAKISICKLKCLQTYRSIQSFDDKFQGLVIEGSVYRKNLCKCKKAKPFESEVFGMLSEFIRFVLKPDFLSEDTSFQKLHDIFTIERFQQFEIGGILTMLSAFLDRHE